MTDHYTVVTAKGRHDTTMTLYHWNLEQRSHLREKKNLFETQDYSYILNLT